jgi:hypothetical protein
LAGGVLQQRIMTNMNKKESIYTVGSELHQTDGKLKTAVMASVVAAAASENDDLKKDKLQGELVSFHMD